MKQKYRVYFIKSMKRDKSGFTGAIKKANDFLVKICIGKISLCSVYSTDSRPGKLIEE